MNFHSLYPAVNFQFSLVNVSKTSSATLKRSEKKKKKIQESREHVILLLRHFDLKITKLLFQFRTYSPWFWFTFKL